MDIGRSDLTLFVYNAAVVLSGGFLVIRFGIEDMNVLIGMSVVFGLFWTIYFRYSMTSILAEIHADAEDKDEDEADSVDEQPPQDEDDAPEQGPDAPWD